jgi:hypothetical protein
MNHIDMIKYLRIVLKLPLNNIKILDEKMNEINEIRNLLIHNNGKVNEYFINKINNDSYLINEKIEINDKLLKNYINIIKENISMIDKEAKELLFKNQITFSIYHND